MWFRLDILERRLLYAAATLDIHNVQPAALDQPRINALLRRGNGDPLAADLFGSSTFNIEAFLDTGASGLLLSNETADGLGITRAKSGGQTITFHDVGVAGSGAFNVSEPLNVSVAPFHPDSDIDKLATWQTVYSQSFGPLRTQIGSVPASDDPFLQNLDVFGMPILHGKVAVLDPKPVDTFLDTMRTYLYDPGTHFNANKIDTAPGIPTTNRHIKLSFASFEPFTSITPSNAPGPTLSDNPFIGPDPLVGFPGNPASDSTPPVIATRGSKSISGSWLLDTGAAASIISKSSAKTLGVSYKSGTFGTDNPILVDSAGDSLPHQFQLTIGGIGGTNKIAGFFLDSLTLPTTEGQPIRFVSAPVLVSDITVEDPSTHDKVTLDGVFGMNYLVASAFITESSPLPDISDLTKGPFDWVVFDQPKGLLGLDVPGAGNISGSTDDTKPPTASLAQNAVPLKNKTSVSFKVSWHDDKAIKAASLSSGDIKVTGPHHFTQNAILVSKNTNANAKSIVATYKISAPGGKWNSTDNGTYTITIRPKEVSDSSGNFVPSGKLASFSFSTLVQRTTDRVAMGFALQGASYLFSLLPADVSGLKDHVWDD